MFEAFERNMFPVFPVVPVVPVVQPSAVSIGASKCRCSAKLALMPWLPAAMNPANMTTNGARRLARIQGGDR